MKNEAAILTLPEIGKSGMVDGVQFDWTPNFAGAVFQPHWRAGDKREIQVLVIPPPANNREWTVQAYRQVDIPSATNHRIIERRKTPGADQEVFKTALKWIKEGLPQKK